MEEQDSFGHQPNTSSVMVKKHPTCVNSPSFIRPYLHDADSASISSTSINGENKIKSIILSKRRQPFHSENGVNLQGSTDHQDEAGVAFLKTLSKKVDNSFVLKQLEVLYGFFDFEVELKLLYRASDHNFSVVKFHQICDFETNTLTLCKTKSNQIIGGYTPLNWAQNYSQNKTYFKTDKDNETFLFSVTKNQKYPLTKVNKNKAICCFRNWGPTFGGGYDLQIGDKADQSCTSVSYFPRSFVCNHKAATQKYITGSKNKQFKILEWQVYKVIRKNGLNQLTKQKSFGRNKSFLETIRLGIFQIFKNDKV